MKTTCSVALLLQKCSLENIICCDLFRKIAPRVIPGMEKGSAFAKFKYTMLSIYSFNKKLFDTVCIVAVLMYIV